MVQVEQDAVGAVMVAEVNGGCGLLAFGDDLPRHEDRADDRHTVEVEPELGREPRQRDEEEKRRDRDPHDVGPAEGQRPAETPSHERGDREYEGDGDPGRRQTVDGPAVEVTLIHDSRKHDGRAQGRRDDRGGPLGRALQPPENDQEDGESDERRRVAEEHQGAPQAALADLRHSRCRGLAPKYGST